ncbi:MAG: pyridoxamine 5'-phosphate oxidase family protein [Micrococcus sp.]|nr:pyridoxamine 5'-phosphate oxidase family protein [Micrococcus sp.]
MMFEHPDGEPMLALNEEQCWKLLSRTHHARLGLSFQGEVDIIPVNIAVKDRAVYFRTAPGSKLAELTVNPRVAVQADGILSDQAWAVLGHGTAERLESEADIAEAEALGITPWVPTLKDFFVRISLDSVTGRHFQFGTHPERHEDRVD